MLKWAAALEVCYCGRHMLFLAVFILMKGQSGSYLFMKEPVGGHVPISAGVLECWELPPQVLCVMALSRMQPNDGAVPRIRNGPSTEKLFSYVGSSEWKKSKQLTMF